MYYIGYSRLLSKKVKEQAEKMILRKSILPGGDREYKTGNLRLIQGFKKETFSEGLRKIKPEKYSLTLAI